MCGGTLHEDAMREGVMVDIACDVRQGIAPHVIVGDCMHSMQSVGSHNEKNAMSLFISISIPLSRSLHIYVYIDMYMYIHGLTHIYVYIYIYI
jgi:hypothetical protein